MTREIVEKPLRQIADELGCSYNAVHYAIRKYGIPIPHRSKYRYADKSEAIKKAIQERYPNGRFGKDSPRWKGGRRTIKSGYVYIYKPDHPNSTKAGYVFEHILLAEEKIGRYLKKGEVVHHINGDKMDNSPENLKVCTWSERVQIHMDAVKEVYSLRQQVVQLKERIAVLEQQS